MTGSAPVAPAIAQKRDEVRVMYAKDRGETVFSRLNDVTKLSAPDPGKNPVHSFRAFKGPHQFSARKFRSCVPQAVSFGVDRVHTGRQIPQLAFSGIAGTSPDTAEQPRSLRQPRVVGCAEVCADAQPPASFGRSTTSLSGRMGASQESLKIMPSTETETPRSIWGRRPGWATTS